MENNPTYVISDRGTKIWRLNGKYHREDGPAVEYKNGDKEYWVHGKIHRLDGPAHIRHNFFTSWWYINGHDVTDEIRTWAKDNDIDLDNLSEDDKLLIKLVWSYYGK